MKHGSALALLLIFRLSLVADEGIWLFDDFPANRVKQKYGVSVTPEFLTHVRLSSVRVFPYGSGSFVSPHGLVFTNHHVASDCIQKLSTEQNNYMRDGFNAARYEDEKACPDLEIDVLERTEDVTAKVNAAAPAATPAAEANRLRKAEMSRIESKCSEAAGDRCEVITLYAGGKYHLYRYKKYSDVRLVFAPEEWIAAFGGDPDNFTYPRYCLDFTFLRVYENGKPASNPSFLRWSKEGVRDGELTFVPGNPAKTERLYTYAALEFNRDVAYPLTLERTERLSAALEKWGTESERNKRVARDELLGWQNSRKAYAGELAGLRDPKLMKHKLEDEQKFRAAVQADPKLREKFGSIWDDVARMYKNFSGFYKRFQMIERGGTGGSQMLDLARTILRYTEEKTKPNEQRLRDYTDAAIPEVERELFSPAPIDVRMEKVILATHFHFLVDKLGPGDPVVKQILGKRSPEEAAAYYADGSKLFDLTERKRLASSLEAARASKDTMMQLARILEPEARALLKRYEDQVEATMQSSAGRVAQARFAVFGASEYPDGTFTLRMSYGPVKGYVNEQGKPVPWTTDFAGLYKRATGKEPFRLPPNWAEAKDLLKLTTPFNFVTTNDTHGGNSGSPTLDSKGEVVGIAFDGNLEGLPNSFVYTDEKARSVHVAAQGIVEALRTIYKSTRLLRELGAE